MHDTPGPDSQNHPQEILDFWFCQTSPKKWFMKDGAFDKQVEQKFRAHVENALNRLYDTWAEDFSARLALILLLDQMTRNIFRDTPRAFSGDPIALPLAMEAIDKGLLDPEADEVKRLFLLLPLMHSEDLTIQDKSLPLFEQYTNAQTMDYARKHREIIARFGRFPHRNAILGRSSTAAEIKFLQQPNAGF